MSNSIKPGWWHFKYPSGHIDKVLVTEENGVLYGKFAAGYYKVSELRGEWISQQESLKREVEELLKTHGDVALVCEILRQLGYKEARFDRDGGAAYYDVDGESECSNS